ncbi:MAG: Bacitracin transporter ATP-binding protein [Fibrobacteres bacterium]|nr:Bacitracin transporter ATP-binding protein [Fibrobacterota bacterium]
MTDAIRDQIAENEARFVDISGVHKLFGSGKSRYHALAGVDLRIAKGEFVSIIGHSGCGKSTLLNLVAGLYQATTGSVAVNGKEVTAPGLDRAVVFQSHSLLPWLTVLENVMVAVDSVHPGKGRQFRLDEARKYVDMVHLAQHAGKKPPQLSGGMKQRVGIARAFAADPQVLLLDEPFGALDALTRGSMQDELTTIWEKNRKTVMMITHDVDEAVFLSDRIVLMSNGPAAVIAKVVDVPIARPRTREALLEDSQYLEIRKELLHYLIGTGMHAAA